VGDSKAFITLQREMPRRRPVHERVGDWNEIYLPFEEPKLRAQASRCMDCGIPFCHSGCPLGNLIPDWNDLVYRNRWKEALDELHATNNFPEFTGRLCPAPCEGACVLGINNDPVTIKVIEQSIIDKGFEEGWVTADPPTTRTGKRVAVVGSGPAGLAAAQQLNRAGHTVTVFERDDRIGGLLRYGIPDFKMEKWVLDRRLNLMAEEGVTFRPGVNVGVDVTAEDLKRRFDAVVLTGGATKPRDLPVPGRELEGIAFAMEYLPQQNKRVAGGAPDWHRDITAKGKRVVILGGGDTGADCLGTSHRQGAREVLQFELMGRPPETRSESNPWPTFPMVLRTSSAHEEGGVRDYGVSTTHFSGVDGKVTKLHAVRVESIPGEDGRPKLAPVAGSEFEVECDLVLLAMGFVHPQHEGLLSDLGVELNARGNVATDADYQTTVPGIFAAGDMRRGQSLIVWAIAEGREAAHGVDKFLMGASRLPLTAYK
jgi:glutamate synthase (NADPH/NADH) small chain